MQNNGVALDSKSASFSWNFEANKGNLRDVFCKNSAFDVNPGKYDIKLSEMEAKCYWTNYPKAGLAIQQAGLNLNKDSASFSWNFEANKDGGQLRNVVCDLMKRDVLLQELNILFV